MTLVAVLASFTTLAAQPGSSVSAPGQGSAVAESFVKDNIAKSLTILINAGLSAQDRSQQLESVLLGMTDTKRIATFTLGAYAQKASQADQDAFAAAFQNYSVAVYRSYFARFSGQTLTVSGSSQRTPDDIIVVTKLIDPHASSGQAPLEVSFRVRTDAGKPVVTDLGVMGIWLALSQRDQFVSYLNANGGSVPKLTTYVQQVATQFASGR